MIGIINMQTNNINCFVKILNRLNFKYKIINTNIDYNENITKLIIPGIGNYKECMEYIIHNNIDEIIKNHIKNKKKILGICIGMQILSSYGEESELTKGLDILKNTKTEKLQTNKILPHIGWNSIKIKNNDIDNLFNNINLNSDFYFVHSFNVIFNDKDITDEDIIFGKTKYGDKEFISVIKNKNILAVQFHPEKSGKNGIKLIENFLNW
jgi:glutamine amidotransferase